MDAEHQKCDFYFPYKSITCGASHWFARPSMGALMTSCEVIMDDNHWNQREKKLPVLQFTLLALLCAILAYVLREVLNKA